MNARPLFLLAVTMTVGCSRPDPSTGQLARALGPSSGMVISQLHGGGGEAGAVLSHDYVELFNRGVTAVALNGWSLQYAPASSDLWEVHALPAVSIDPGRYYLVRLASQNETVGAALPVAPDSVGTLNLSPASGKVALLQSATACGSGCASAASLVDLVGYGTASEFEGAAAPALGTNTALIRKGGGCVETNSNATDFATGTWTAALSLDLHASASPAAACATSDAGPDGASASDAALPEAGARESGTVVQEAGSVDGKLADAAKPVSDGKLADAAKPVSDGVKPVSDGVKPSTDGGVAPRMVVISQIYGAGGNSGASFSRDFVELFNRGAQTVQLGGWSIQYGSAAGGFTQKLALPAGASIAPGRYFLIQLAGGTTSAAALPTPDAGDAGPGAFNISASAGKMALVISTTTLACGTATNRCKSPAIEDLVGYGTASDYEGTAAAKAPSSASASVQRKNGGCVDTDNNAGDFVTAPVTPRNSGSPLRDCSILPPDSGVVSPDLPPRRDQQLSQTDQSTSTADLPAATDDGLTASDGRPDARRPLPPDDEGCSCGVGGTRGSEALMPLFLLLGLILARRGRRRRAG